MRLHLIKVLDLQSSPTVLPSALAHHVETLSSPPKHTRQYTWVEMPGIEPGSTAPSLGRNYNNIVIIRHTYLCVNRGPSYHHIWRTWKLVKDKQKNCGYHNYTNSKTVVLIHSLSLQAFNSIMAYNNRATVIIENMINMINYNLLCFCRQSVDCLLREHLVIDYDHVRVVVDHSPIWPTRLLSSNNFLLASFFVVPWCRYLVGGPWKNWTFTPSIMSRLLYH